MILFYQGFFLALCILQECSSFEWENWSNHLSIPLDLPFKGFLHIPTSVAQLALIEALAYCHQEGITYGLWTLIVILLGPYLWENDWAHFFRIPNLGFSFSGTCISYTFFWFQQMAQVWWAHRFNPNRHMPTIPHHPGEHKEGITMVHLNLLVSKNWF